MSIISDSDILAFLGTQQDYFTITVSNDTMVMKYDAGANTNIHITDGTYTGTDLASSIKSAIDIAFTITSTVSWSSSTRLFTIAVSAGHTIQYINSGSDLGSTIGFTTNSSAAVSISSDTACGDPTAMALSIRDAVEDWIESECRRTFASTSYTLERYSGDGSNYLYLKNYPVTNITQLSIGTQDAFYVYNTNDNTLATVSVTSTGVTLNKDGTESTLLFADYATMTLMVAAINAVGNGWVATLSSSTMGPYKTTQLIKRFGASAIDENYVYLKIPDDPLDDFEVFENRGLIYYSGGFVQGNNNVFISYTSGYSSYPSDLTLGIKIFVKSVYDKYKNENWNISSFRIGDISYSYNSSSMEIPIEVKQIISKYKRRLI